MNNLEIFTTAVNQIFACLEKLDVDLESQENSNNISNIKEYKESAISFAKLISTEPDSNNNQNLDSNDNVSGTNQNTLPESEVINQ